jgi:demethylmenaquinone methyltransferase/2-methoxy-6-polyprenyl-1,4-benzoquinol methylase
MTAGKSEKAELFAYYDARADGYEDFYQGRGAAIAPLADEYPIDTAGVSALLSSFGRGDVIDLACGTGFWLSAYSANCASVTLVDQSGPALARCRQRVEALGLPAMSTTIVQGDLFEARLPEASYDSCLLGFLLSHLTDPQTDALFDRLRIILRPRSEIAVIDSVWSEARRPYCQRESFERRTVPDGPSFMIRKKYYDRLELESLLLRHGFMPRAEYSGNVFIAMLAYRVR